MLIRRLGAKKLVGVVSEGGSKERGVMGGGLGEKG